MGDEKVNFGNSSCGTLQQISYILHKTTETAETVIALIKQRVEKGIFDDEENK